MRCAALIVLAMVALVLSACAGRKAEPWTLPTYGKPAPRYTPIPPLGERESTGGRVFFVAVLDEAKDHASLDLWNSTEIQGALNSVGTNRLMGKYDGRSVSWDLPRPAMSKGTFAYVDGREIDRDLPFSSAADLVDWIGRVRARQFGEAYADARLSASGGASNALALQVHGLRMVRLGLYDRAMDSLMRAWDLTDKPSESPGPFLILLMRDLSLAHQPFQERLASMARDTANAWHSEDFNGVCGPLRQDHEKREPPDEAQWAMDRFADLCVASHLFDDLDARIAACKDDSSGNLERAWLMSFASTSAGILGFLGNSADQSLGTYSGRLDIDPVAQARQEVMRPLALLSLSGAPRDSTLRQLEPDLRRAGFAIGMKWCQCQAGGRRNDAGEILALVTEGLDYPGTIEGFLRAGITFGVLPSTTDEWLARDDLDPKRRELLREGVELLRRQPLMPASTE